MGSAVANALAYCCHMARRKLSTTVYITHEQDQALRLLHARTGVAVAQYIRQGIDLVLIHCRDQLPGQVDLSWPTATLESPTSVNDIAVKRRKSAK
jgi:hypothetical protein